MRRARLAMIVVAAAAAACRSPSPAPEGGDAAAAAAAASASASAPAPAAAGISVLVDGEPAGVIEDGPLAALIADRAPPSTWRRIEADAPGGPTMVVLGPTDAYRDQDARVYRQRGRLALGMFRRVAADASEAIRALAANPTVSLAGVTEIRVRTRAVARPEAPSVAIELVAGERRCTLDERGLATIPPLADARGGADRPGWDVGALVAHCFGAAPARIRAAGLDVDAATLARADRRVLVKINRRGELRVRLVEPGRRTPLGEAIDPTRLEVTLSDAPR